MHRKNRLGRKTFEVATIFSREHNENPPEAFGIQTFSLGEHKGGKYCGQEIGIGKGIHKPWSPILVRSPPFLPAGGGRKRVSCLGGEGAGGTGSGVPCTRQRIDRPVGDGEEDRAGRLDRTQGIRRAFEGTSSFINRLCSFVDSGASSCIARLGFTFSKFPLTSR